MRPPFCLNSNYVSIACRRTATGSALCHPADDTVLGVLRGRALLFACAAQGITEVVFRNNFEMKVFKETVDIKSLLFNLAGALLMGLGTGVEEHSGCANMRRVASAFRGGFIGILTSFAWFVEHLASFGTPWFAELFVVAALVAGVAINHVGYTVASGALRKAPPVSMGSGALVQLSLVLVAVVLGCLCNDPDPTEDHLFFGCLFAIAAVVLGEHIGGFPHYEDHPNVRTASVGIPKLDV